MMPAKIKMDIVVMIGQIGRCFVAIVMNIKSRALLLGLTDRV